MVDTFLRHSPLDAFQPKATAGSGSEGARATATVSARPYRGQLALRGDPRASAFAEGVRAVLGVELPVTANTAHTEGATSLLWLGPDEWLAVVPDGEEERLRHALAQRLSDVHHAVTDVSSSRVVLGLDGSDAREVLAKGCALDFHPSVFGPGRCDQSLLARVHVLVHLLGDDPPRFDIYVHRSFADYAWRWLTDAAREFGPPGD